MEPVELIEAKREKIVALCRRYGVRRLWLFGSAVRGGWDPTKSDFDFLVDYGPEAALLSPLQRLVGLQLDLEEVLGRAVDAVDRSAATNSLFLFRAAAEAVEIYAA